MHIILLVLSCCGSFQTVKSFSTGEIGRIYKENAWQEATVTFSDYGPGVRIVAFTSKGRKLKSCIYI